MAYEVWSMVTVIVAAIIFIPLLLSQACQALIFTFFHWMGANLFPAHGRCSLLIWDDIPSGPLHECREGYCWHWTPDHHARMRECWTQYLFSPFNRAMSRRSNIRFVKKHPDLAFRGQYLSVDVRVIVVLLLCSTGETKSSSSEEASSNYASEAIFCLLIRDARSSSLGTITRKTNWKSSGADIHRFTAKGLRASMDLFQNPP